MCGWYDSDRRARFERMINYHGRRANGKDPLESIPVPDEVRLEHVRRLALSRPLLVTEQTSPLSEKTNEEVS